MLPPPQRRTSGRSPEPGRVSCAPAAPLVPGRDDERSVPPLRHDHWFDAIDAGTSMRDAFEFSTILPLLDSLVLVPHLRRFLAARNELLRRAAEGDGWRRYLG